LFFDRPDSGELAVLVHLNIDRTVQSDDPREFEELVIAAGGDPVALLSGYRSVPDSKFFIGSGKLRELEALVRHHCAELVILNHELSPSQERNIERAIDCRVLDRNGLILDIFAQRARSHEGKLQVELAQLHHMSTRLIRGWTHLERQKGGIGLRGPGETQLETDRRLLRGRIKSINRRLEKVRKQRQQGRRARSRADLPTISLVGYTNAGKSTLFNAVTQAGVFAENQLFATLDPTMRRIDAGASGPVILADTVGFISHLPHRLVEAFRATLEEAANADLLLHVIDAAAEERSKHIEQVNVVLEEIGANDIPQLLVFNKIDLINTRLPRIDRGKTGKPSAVWLSAQNGLGVNLLLQAVAELVGGKFFHNSILLSPQEGSLRARLYRHNAVLEERYLEDGSSRLDIRLPETDLVKLLAAEELTIDSLKVNNDDEHRRLMTG